MELIQRDILPMVIARLERREIIAIRGPRQAGKSTLLMQIKEFLVGSGIDEKNVVYYTFEDPEVIDNFAKDPIKFFKMQIRDKKRYYFLLDEIQYDKLAGKHLKLAFDSIKNIKIIITGSSSLDIAQVSKFLVGRILLYDLYTLSFGEYLKYYDVGLYNIFDDNRLRFWSFIEKGKSEIKSDILFLKKLNSMLADYLIFGGYPEVAKSTNTEEKMELLKNIYATYIGKDVTNLFGITETFNIRNMIVNIALQIGSILDYKELSDASHTYYSNIINYLNITEETYIAKRLFPFHKNLRTELKKNPKIYFLDLGLRNYIAKNFNDLEHRDDIGHVVENFVFNEICKKLQPDSLINFWRTKAGAEVDFIISSGSQLIPVEVKFKNFKKAEISTGMRSFIESYRPQKAIVVTKDFIGSVKLNSTKLIFIPAAHI